MGIGLWKSRFFSWFSNKLIIQSKISLWEAQIFLTALWIARIILIRGTKWGTSATSVKVGSPFVWKKFSVLINCLSIKFCACVSLSVTAIWAILLWRYFRVDGEWKKKTSSHAIIAFLLILMCNRPIVAQYRFLHTYSHLNALNFYHCDNVEHRNCYILDVVLWHQKIYFRGIPCFLNLYIASVDRRHVDILAIHGAFEALSNALHFTLSKILNCLNYDIWVYSDSWRLQYRYSQ